MPGKIAIIGAGVAGLSAGVYARLNGYEAEIFESHSMSGGLCTAWKRGDYVFDGCIHWLAGAGPQSPFYRLWEEVGAIQGRSFLYPQVFTSNQGKDGRRFLLYTDVDKLQAHLTELSPVDAKQSAHFCGLIRALSRLRIRMDKAFELYGPLDLLKMALDARPAAREWAFCARTTLHEYALRFQDPLLRQGLVNAIGPDGILAALVFTLSDLWTRSAAYPLGGSLPFARAIEQRFLGLGGKLHYRSAVKRVVVEAQRAVGIELVDGPTLRVDRVISAADLRRNLEVLLEGRFPSPKHDKLFAQSQLRSAAVQVSFGVGRVYPDSTHAIGNDLELQEPIRAGNRSLPWLRWRNHGSDPSFAPEGKSVITSLLETDYESWSRLGHSSTEYREAKASLAKQVMQALDRVLPEFSEAVEVVDVATPVTFERFTHNHQGHFMTWIPDKHNTRDTQLVPKTVPGLSNFHMVGMWLMGPGGLPPAVKTARDAIEVICRQDGRQFRTRN